MLSFRKALFSSAILAASIPALAEPLAYVTNQASEDRVWVIDTATNTVVDTITVADIPSRVAITPDGAFAYVTIVVNEEAMEQQGSSFLFSSIPSSPVFMGSADSASSASASFFSNKIEVIDTATNTIVATVTTEEEAPFGIAITPDGVSAYVTHLTGSVTAIDTATNTASATIPVGGEALDVAISPDGTFAYVTISSSNTVAVIDTATNTLAASVTVGGMPSGIAISPDGAFAYVTNLSSNTISRISIPDHTVSATLAVGEAPGSIAITPDGTLAYVTNQLSGNVSVIDTATTSITATVAVGDTPIDVAITPDGMLAYATNIFSDSVSVIDTATNTLVDTVEVGFLPEGIAVTPGEPTLEVKIDIQPWTRHNPVSAHSRRSIWVVVFSAEDFDPLQLDVATVRFGPSEARAVFDFAFDINRDGVADQLLRFSSRETGIQCGDTEVRLSGQTFAEEQVVGTDLIRTVGCS
jgi:YVTN family beta-propeller protein